MRSAASLRSYATAAGAWTPVAFAIVVLSAILALCHDVVFTAVSTWYGSASFGHCFLVPPICVWLVWQRRAELALPQVRSSFAGLTAMAAACLALLVGHATETTVVEELSLIATVQAAVLTLFGWPIWKRLSFPLLYLYFAVPFGEALVPPLQAITADLVVAMLRAIGTPVFADGNLISVPVGDFYVAEACSGIRYLIASLALGSLFAAIAYQSWTRRAIFLAMSVAIPVLANAVRAFGIILAADILGKEAAMGIDHVIYGWLFFVLVTALTLSVGWTFRDARQTKPRRTWGASGGIDRLGSSRSLAIAAMLALLPLLMVELYAEHIDGPPREPPLRPVLPDVEGGWREMSGDLADAPATFAAPDAELNAIYADRQNSVDLQIGYYAHNRRRARAVTGAHDFDRGQRWTEAASGTTVAVIDGTALSIQYRRLVNGRSGRLIWHWYWIDGHLTGNPYLAKLLEAKAKLIGGEQRAAIVAATADYADAPAEAEQALRRFLVDIHGLSASLGRW